MTYVMKFKEMLGIAIYVGIHAKKYIGEKKPNHASPS